jgi:hypothetical protein
MVCLISFNLIAIKVKGSELIELYKNRKVKPEASEKNG